MSQGWQRVCGGEVGTLWVGLLELGYLISHGSLCPPTLALLPPKQPPFRAYNKLNNSAISIIEQPDQN